MTASIVLRMVVKATATRRRRRYDPGIARLDLLEQRMHMAAGRTDQVQKLAQLGHATD